MRIEKHRRTYSTKDLMTDRLLPETCQQLLWYTRTPSGFPNSTSIAAIIKYTGNHTSKQNDSH